VIWRARCQCYTDRDYAIRNLPLELSGLYGVRTADLDYDSESEKLVRFKLVKPSIVYIVYKAKAHALPIWLRGGLYPFFVYNREFPAGAFALGGARAKGYSGIVFMNYLIAFKPL
jgi:hypothetical protein